MYNKQNETDILTTLQSHENKFIFKYFYTYFFIRENIIENIHAISCSFLDPRVFEFVRFQTEITAIIIISMQC